MFTLHNLQLRQMVAKVDRPTAVLSDAEEDHHARNARISEQARGNLPMDPVRDLPKMEDAALQGAKGVEAMIDTFNPGPENPKKIPSKLSNCDGVAVPQTSPVWKNVFRPVIRSLPVSKAEEESGGEIWRTIRGRRVQIKEGESVKEAYDRDVKEQGGQRGAGQTEERGARVAQGKKFATISPRGRVLIHQAEAMLKERGITRERFMTKVDGQLQELHRMKDKYGVERVLTGKEVTKFLSKETDSLNGMGKESAPEKPVAAQFVSPNKEQHLTLEQSVANLGSERQQWLLREHSRVDKFAGIEGSSTSTIGEWPDPTTSGTDTENSSLDSITQLPNEEALRYSAAWKGLQAEQISVLNFVRDEKGEDGLYRLDIPDVSNDLKGEIERLRVILDSAGLPNHTFVREKSGLSVAIFSFKSADDAAVLGVAKFINAKVRQDKGRGEFFGADIPDGTTPDEARKLSAKFFKEYIDQHEAKTGKKYRPTEEVPVQKSRLGGMTMTRFYLRESRQRGSGVGGGT